MLGVVRGTKLSGTWNDRKVDARPTEKSEVKMIEPNKRRAFQATAAFPLY
jgi:hypothetical protein